MIKKKEEIFAFIDSQNINLGTQSDGWKLDWGKFRLFLMNKYQVTRIFFFIGYISKNKKLYKYLQNLGYILIFKNVLSVRKDNETTYKGNVDAELVMHTMIQINNFDKAIIISGDGDFFCLIEYLEANKKLLKVITPNSKYSSLIRRYSSYIYNLYVFRNKLSR